MAKNNSSEGFLINPKNAKSQERIEKAILSRQPIPESKKNKPDFSEGENVEKFIQSHLSRIVFVFEGGKSIQETEKELF